METTGLVLSCEPLQHGVPIQQSPAQRGAGRKDITEVKQFISRAK